VLATQNGVPFFQPQELRAAHQAGARCSAVRRLPGGDPTYYGGFMALGWASNGLDLAAPDSAAIAARYAALDLATRYYNPAIHQAAFALPNFVQALLG